MINEKILRKEILKGKLTEGFEFMYGLLNKYFISLLLGACFMFSCSKGYQVRVTNYFIEPIDSVIIGKNKLVLKDIKLEETTDFYSISKGIYEVQFISSTKKRFNASLTIPGSGSGKRTIQIDGISQISILEE